MPSYKFITLLWTCEYLHRSIDFASDASGFRLISSSGGFHGYHRSVVLHMVLVYGTQLIHWQLSQASSSAWT